MRQLTASCLVFATDEHEGFIPCGVCFLSYLYPWHAKGGVDPAAFIPSTGTVVAEGYLPNDPSLFRCPTDDMQTVDTGVGGFLQPVIPRPFSYTQNFTMVAGSMPDDPSSGNMFIPPADSRGAFPIDQFVKNPSQTPFFVEEGTRFNDGYFFGQVLEDTLSERHRGKSHASYYDGHVEMVNARAFNALDVAQRVQVLNPQ